MKNRAVQRLREANEADEANRRRIEAYNASVRADSTPSRPDSPGSGLSASQFPPPPVRVGPARLTPGRWLLTAWIGFLCFMAFMIMGLSPMACDGQAPGCQRDVNINFFWGAGTLAFEVILLLWTPRAFWRAESSGRRLRVLGVSALLSVVVPVVALFVLGLLFP